MGLRKTSRFYEKRETTKAGAGVVFSPSLKSGSQSNARSGNVEKLGRENRQRVRVVTSGASKPVKT